MTRTWDRPKVQVQLLDQSCREAPQAVYGSSQRKRGEQTTLSSTFKFSGRTSFVQSMFCVGVQAQNVRHPGGNASRRPGKHQQEGGNTCSR